MTEVAYTSIARLAAAAGNGDEALSAARKVVAQGLAPRLRTFVPALMAFAASGQVLRCSTPPARPWLASHAKEYVLAGALQT